MTSLRWDNVPKRRVERPPLLAPGPKPGRRKQKPPNLRDRIGEAGGARTELQDLSRSANAAAHATGANRRSGRCSACRARGVTLWQVAGRLVCAICRAANQVAYTPQSGRRQEQDHRKATRRERTVTAVIAEKDITWAAGQGANDRNAGTVCPKYKNFLGIYKLPRSPFTLRMWDAYRFAGQSTPQNIARPGSRRDRLIAPDAPRKLPPPQRRERTPNGLQAKGARTASQGKHAGSTRLSSSLTGYTNQIARSSCGESTTGMRGEHISTRQRQGPSRKRAGLVVLFSAMRQFLVARPRKDMTLASPGGAIYPLRMQLCS